MRWLAAASSILWTAVMAGAGCGGGAETQATATASGAGGAGGGCNFACSPCGTCMQEACAVELMQCNADPECASYASCVLACPVASDGNADPACVDACPTGTSSAAKKASAALLACRQEGKGATCSACNVQACPAPESQYLNEKCGGSTETNPCFICEDEKCCDSYMACHDEPDCTAFHTCEGMCPVTAGMVDPLCIYDCGTKHQTGLAFAGQLEACMRFHCAVEQTACVEASRTDCERCEYECECGDRYADLLSTVEGYLLYYCDLGCALNDTACDEKCLNMYPTGMDAWVAYGQCLLAKCQQC